jgi:hypothetical protein
MPALDFQRIHDALEMLSRRLGERGVKGEVCLFGGAAFILAFQSRQSTKDIDAIFVPTSIVRELVAQIGEESGYAEGWFNDGVKGFISDKHSVTAADLPQFENLTVTMPVPEYLLAMKCMAARVDLDESKDEQDARFLIKNETLYRNPFRHGGAAMSPIPIASIPAELHRGTPISIAMGNFLDAFYLFPLAESLEEPPPPSGNATYDAYFAAVAETLARRYRLRPPAWAFEDSRYLHRPYFASQAPALRATLLLESPPAFRCRNIFVTCNALDRASQHQTLYHVTLPAPTEKRWARLGAK